MTRPIVRTLIATDLYLVRWHVLGALAAGAAAVAMMPLGSVAAYVGGVSLICILVILNILLVMGSIVQEKKDKVQLFMLSLPVSTRQYSLAKAAANAIAFVVPWTLLTAAVSAVITVSDVPDGLLPFLLAVLVYLLLYYCVLLAIGLTTDRTGWHAVAITLGNVSVNFLIPLLLSLPSVARHHRGPAAVWTADIVGIIAVELGLAVAAFGAGLYLRSRQTDFV